jgi:hypothetical protein
MSSDRPSRIAAPNVGRRRWGCFNWYPRAPPPLNLSSHRPRPSINSRSNLNSHRRPATLPSLSIRSSRKCRSKGRRLSIPPSNLSNPVSHRAIRSSNSR